MNKTHIKIIIKRIENNLKFSERRFYTNQINKQDLDRLEFKAEIRINELKKKMRNGVLYI